ncbi:MAG: FHA domain-containing protein [Myxococcales bacterium]|jgi:pSer/pThr/pTyr-binding forkhead associated (FHA) protein
MGVRLVVRSIEGRPVNDTRDGEIAYGFEQERILIGRGAGADVRIADLTVSERHATVALDRGHWTVVDHDSTNGTRLNGAPVTPGRKTRLTSGDVLGVGLYELSFESGIPTQPITAERTSELARRLFRTSRQGAGVGGPRLVVLAGPATGQSLEVPPPPARLIVGRDEGCQLSLDDPDVSREHMELVRDLDGVLARDLESKNGILIDGKSVAQRRLRDGDELTLGGTRLLFEEPAEEPMEALTAEQDRALSADEIPAPPQPPTESAAKAPQTAPARPSTPTAPAGPSMDADLIIYALAGVIILVSLAGLFVLMRGG